MKGALLDTDTDWNDKTRLAARKGKMPVMACQPCFEAVLRTTHHAQVEGRTTAQLKQDLTVRFAAAAPDGSILRHFSREVLDEARSRIAVLDALLNLLTKAQTAN